MATPTYVPLATITLATTDTEVVFASIPSTFKDLIVVVSGNTSASARPVMRFNTDTASNYSAVMMAGGTYSATSSGTYLDPIPDYSVTGRFSSIWQVMDYSSATNQKTVLVRLNQHDGTHVHASAGRWAGTAAVNAVRILTNNGNSYAVGTTFSIYGVH